MSQFKTVPFNPTPDQYGGLGRSLIMWVKQAPRTTPESLVHFYTSYIGEVLPEWLQKEIDDHGGCQSDHAMPKGTIATLIYKAMLSDFKEEPSDVELDAKRYRFLRNNELHAPGGGKRYVCAVVRDWGRNLNDDLSNKSAAGLWSELDLNGEDLDKEIDKHMKGGL